MATVCQNSLYRGSFRRSLLSKRDATATKSEGRACAIFERSPEAIAGGGVESLDGIEALPRRDFSVPTFEELYKIAHYFNCFEKLRGGRSMGA
jgi:hypothetical protein